MPATQHLILVASYTSEVYTLAFDPETSTLSVLSSTAVGHHPSWIASHPDDGSLVFAGLEQPNGRIVALKYDREGKGTIVAEASSGGDDPCSLVATTDELFIANYSSGSVTTMGVSAEPPFLRFETSRTQKLHGSGPNARRQEGPHPHQVVLVNEGGCVELLVPDLGTDAVRRFRKVESGEWRQHGQVLFESGGGPRHIAFHDGYMYTILELANKLVQHTFPPSPAAPTYITSLSTMCNPPSESLLPSSLQQSAPSTPMLAAEILIPPPTVAFPTPYIYVSNRNDPSLEGDIISVFSPSTCSQDAHPASSPAEPARKTGSLDIERVAEIRSGLTHLRGMAFGGQDDKWLVAGGVNGGGVRVFERIQGGRGLRLAAENKDVAAPTGFLWLRIGD